MDTALPQKFPFILDRNLAKANCTEDRVCTSCDTVVLAHSHINTRSQMCTCVLQALPSLTAGGYPNIKKKKIKNSNKESNTKATAQQVPFNTLLFNEKVHLNKDNLKKEILETSKQCKISLKINFFLIFFILYEKMLHFLIEK